MKQQHTPAAKEFEDRLQKWLADARRVIIAGIGNPLRKDDFVGVEVVRKLQQKVSRDVFLIECETVPESFLDQITEFNPTHILIIDAALLNLKPGFLKLIETAQLMGRTAISTHALPLQIFCEYLQRATGAKIALLIIQPADTDFGEGLTAPVEETAQYLTNLLPKIVP
jgi:hydrogenase 3 maturation protease